MSSRLLCAAALCLGVVTAFAADLPQNSPFGQAGAPAGSTVRAGTLQFAGVSTLGNQTIINLYNPGDKSSSWVQVGTTSDGVTVVSYDSNHDQVTIRQNGVEKVLPLQPPVAVVSGPTTAVPVLAPIQPAPAPATNTPAMSAEPVASAASPATPTGTATTSLSRARQEEEARMLVSDLLEIGMAQRRAYEEAKRKQAEQAAQSGQQPAPTAPAASQPSAPAATGSGS